MITKNLSFLLLIIAFVFFTNSQLHAQTTKRDSILNAIKIKRTQDSLIRVETRLQLQKQRDSLQTAIKAKRTADSLGRVALVKERINERKKQDSIVAFKKKFAQDSIEASKKGITITLKDLLQEKENEKIRLKKLEEKIAKQKLEDSTFWAVKTIKEKEDKRLQDSITTENLKIEAQKQKALLVEQKRIQDSIIVAKQVEEENLRIANEKMIVEQKRIEDSTLIAKKIQEELVNAQQELLFAKQKKYNDSLLSAQEALNILNKIAEEKLTIVQKRYNDSLALAQQKKIAEDKILYAKLLVQQKRYNDSLKIMQDLEREKNNTVLARYYAKTDTTTIDKNELKLIKDSLETAERIRLQELKYAKQRIEDSLSLISLQKIDAVQITEIVSTKDSIKQLDSLKNIETVKIDSVQMIKDTFLYVEESFQKKATLISFNFGLSNYLGDLGGNNGVGKKFFYDNNFKKQTYMYGFSLTKVWREALGLRLSFNTGTVAGSDSDVAYEDPNDNAYYSYKRNLDFTSKISEWSAMIEIRPYKFLNRTKGLFKSALQPYGLLGIGKFKFNPQGSYYDEISQDYLFVDLAPLKTEGQGMVEYPNRKPYKLNQTNIPFGFGINYLLGAKTSMSFEFVGRKLFTDYLDDVSTTFVDPSVFANYFSGEDLEIAQTMTNKSTIIDPNNPYGVGAQRGNSKNNDFYYSFNLKLNIQINKIKRKVLK